MNFRILANIALSLAVIATILAIVISARLGWSKLHQNVLLAVANTCLLFSIAFLLQHSSRGHKG